MTSFSDQVASLCYQHFEKLPKKGKPQSNKEWTLLAAIILSSENCNKEAGLKVVAMSTGTKCLGESQLSCQGDILSDSHAEVLVRRAFIRYLYHHMKLLLQKKKSDILDFNESSGKFSLKPEIKLYFFVSHVPCGDAAIFPKSYKGLHVDSSLESKRKKFKKDDSDDDLHSDNFHEDECITDIYRTGAKCVKGDLQDPKESGKDYHITGTLRTKPGRGIPTLSMSCSDKIAVWNVCGIQGALLSHFLESPIYVSSFIFGKCPYSEKALIRAIYERLFNIEKLPSSYYFKKPAIQQSSLTFKYSRENITRINDKAVPCPSSIIWIDIPNGLQVSVNGKKQGVTKKNFNKSSSRLFICRLSLFEVFIYLANELSCYNEKYKDFVKEGITYMECKKSANEYQAAKKEIFKIFHSWVHKPSSLQMFTIFK